MTMSRVQWFAHVRVVRQPGRYLIAVPCRREKSSGSTSCDRKWLIWQSHIGSAWSVDSNMFTSIMAQVKNLAVYRVRISDGNSKGGRSEELRRAVIRGFPGWVDSRRFSLLIEIWQPGVYALDIRRTMRHA